MGLRESCHNCTRNLGRVEEREKNPVPHSEQETPVTIEIYDADPSDVVLITWGSQAVFANGKTPSVGSAEFHALQFQQTRFQKTEFRRHSELGRKNLCIRTLVLRERNGTSVQDGPVVPPPSFRSLLCDGSGREFRKKGFRAGKQVRPQIQIRQNGTNGSDEIGSNDDVRDAVLFPERNIVLEKGGFREVAEKTPGTESHGFLSGMVSVRKMRHDGKVPDNIVGHYGKHGFFRCRRLERTRQFKAPDCDGALIRFDGLGRQEEEKSKNCFHGTVVVPVGNEVGVTGMSPPAEGFCKGLNIQNTIATVR